MGFSILVLLSAILLAQGQDDSNYCFNGYGKSARHECDAADRPGYWASKCCDGDKRKYVPKTDVKQAGLRCADEARLEVAGRGVYDNLEECVVDCKDADDCVACSVGTETPLVYYMMSSCDNVRSRNTGVAESFWLKPAATGCVGKISSWNNDCVGKAEDDCTKPNGFRPSKCKWLAPAEVPAGPTEDCKAVSIMDGAMTCGGLMDIMPDLCDTDYGAADCKCMCGGTVEVAVGGFKDVTDQTTYFEPLSGFAPGQRDAEGRFVCTVEGGPGGAGVEGGCYECYTADTETYNWGAPCVAKGSGSTMMKEGVCGYGYSCLDPDNMSAGKDWPVDCPYEDYCPPKDCEGTWSECSADCAREWTETVPQFRTGAACPAATDCSFGQGECMDVTEINTDSDFSDIYELTDSRACSVNAFKTPAGDMITGNADCERAAEKLGLEFDKSYRATSLPSGCVWSKKKGKFVYNTYQSAAKGPNAATADYPVVCEKAEGCKGKTQSWNEECEGKEAGLCTKKPANANPFQSTRCKWLGPIPDTDCEGSWSTCTAACETADQREWTQTAAPSGNGMVCPDESADCGNGDGECVIAPPASNCEGFKFFADMPSNWCNELSQWAICGIADGVVRGPGYDCKFEPSETGTCKDVNGNDQCLKFLTTPTDAVIKLPCPTHCSDNVSGWVSDGFCDEECRPCDGYNNNGVFDGGDCPEESKVARSRDDSDLPAAGSAPLCWNDEMCVKKGYTRCDKNSCVRTAETYSITSSNSFQLATYFFAILGLITIGHGLYGFYQKQTSDFVEIQEV